MKTMGKLVLVISMVFSSTIVGAASPELKIDEDGIVNSAKLAISRKSPNTKVDSSTIELIGLRYEVRVLNSAPLRMVKKEKPTLPEFQKEVIVSFAQIKTIKVVDNCAGYKAFDVRIPYKNGQLVLDELTIAESTREECTAKH